ncbi:MAG: 23S rRNA (uracil(1939)-C(5))-methyltransferase RlmD [Clostridiales bacterium]|nr:23S rRNA (uracil(1939)-C(5))-methyltransferase RlmD [Clostridiales bacterium]
MEKNMSAAMPVCPISENCGGCIYQGVSYEEQLAEKDRGVRTLLEKYDVDPSVYQGMVPAMDRYRYRNKMEYTFGDLEKDGPLTLGMHKKKHFMSIVTSDCCQLVPEDFNRILRGTLEFCRERGYKFYHKMSHEGLLRNLVVRRGVKTGELLVDIVTSSQVEFDEEGFLNMIMGLPLDEKIVGVLHTTNDRVADAVIDEGTKILFGRDYYNEEILGLKFKVSIFSFFQTNIPAIERLYSDALDLMPDIDSKNVFDLYCGTGTITQLMASRARHVTGIEIVQDSVDSALANTEINGIENCDFICGDVLKVIGQVEEKPDMIVVDPPRAGMHDKVVDILSGYGIPQLMYISCNPKTMCINLQRFKSNGYEPVFIKSYDNFPGTKHVETVVLMSKKDT